MQLNTNKTVTTRTPGLLKEGMLGGRESERGWERERDREREGRERGEREEINGWMLKHTPSPESRTPFSIQNILL